FAAIEHEVSLTGELSGGPSNCGLDHPWVVRSQRYRSKFLCRGCFTALAKKILFASGDRQGEVTMYGTLFICSGLVQPWSVFSVI
ncbi:MAG: hypothetical protein ACYS6K_16135, partial [Planctomycetota bacterium]